VLETLDQGEQAGTLSRLADDLPLFAAAQQKAASEADGGRDNAGASEIEERLRATNPDELTPKAALELVYALREMVNRRG
jgi:DNA mismatch repair protein MutS